VATAAIVGEQLLLTRELHAHATNPDDVDLRFQRDRLDVLVYDLDFPVRRAQRRQRGQAQRRVHGPLVRQNLGKRPLGAPEALRKSRVNQQQAHVNRPFGLRRVVQQGLHSQLFFCSYLLYRRSRST